MKKLIGAIVSLVFLVVIVFVLDRIFQIETEVQETTGYRYSSTDDVMVRVKAGEAIDYRLCSPTYREDVCLSPLVIVEIP